MATYAVIPHRLIPGVSGVSSDAQNLTITNNNAGGFGTAEWDTFSAPGLAKGDAVVIGLEGTAFEGKVASVTTGVGEKLSYHVACVGHFDEFKQDETVEGVFVDRDMAMWQATDCNNWGVAPDFQISVDASASLHFAWPDTDKTMCYQSDTATGYSDHVGNAIPRRELSDFPAAEKLWSAAYYQMPGSKRISGLSFELDFYMNFEFLDQMKTPDYTSPIGPPDEKYGHRFSKYPRINYWTDFYGLASPPLPLYFGAYVCDEPSDLPAEDPIAMRSDAHALFVVDGGFAGPNGGLFPGGCDTMKLRFPCDGKLIVFYAAYLPVQLPFNLATKYSKNADHLVRTKWVARNRIFNPWAGPGMTTSVNVKNVSVYGQGYESAADGSDDLADVFAILFPTAVCDSMPLPAPIDDSAPTSIALRTPTTLCASVPELLALYPVEMNYGWWEDKVLTITRDAGSVSVSDEPGVDTTGAALSDEGAVDLVQVAFSPAPETIPAPGQMIVTKTAYLTVDISGAYELVPDDWQPAAGQRVAFIDATGTASSEIAAARIGQATAIARRPAQWTGAVNLHAIAGASTFRPGQTLSAPGVSGALITSTTVNVDGDSVILQLGNTGYIGRFPARVPGKPQTASPLQPIGQKPVAPRHRGRSGGRG